MTKGISHQHKIGTASGTPVTSLRFLTLLVDHLWCMQLQSGKQKIKPPVKQSSSHCVVVQASIGATLTTLTSVVISTLAVSAATTTNQLDFILEDCVNRAREVPNTMAPMLEMATSI